MIELITVIFLWLIAIWAAGRLAFVDPRGWLQVIFVVLKFGIWALGFFIIVWLTPGVPL